MKGLMLAAALAAAAAAPGAAAATLNHAAVACRTAQESDQALQEIGSRDWNALALQIARGDCTMLKAGTVVYVLGGGGLLSDSVKIRVRGSDVPVWTWARWVQEGSPPG